MMAAGSFYPYSCNPNDVMEARISNNKITFSGCPIERLLLRIRPELLCKIGHHAGRTAG